MQSKGTQSSMETPTWVPEQHAGGAEQLVELDPQHPGFNDPVYRRRRNEIAKKAFVYRHGDPAPLIDYSPEEHGVWAEVWRHLDPIHERFACSSYLECSRSLALDRQAIPQLAALNQALEPRTGFKMLPVAGLISTRTFLVYLKRRIFLSTQYIRHHATPLYTPEPDIVHEVVGHAAFFLHPEFSELNCLFGHVAEKADEALLNQLSSLYWYTIEFGAVREAGKVKAYGAGLLSSFGELGRFVEHAELKPLRMDEVVAQPYDPTQYQSTIYIADSFEHVLNEVGSWLEARRS